ncbi:MAG: IMP dehydrogenase [Phycisphaerales bacterium]|nr:IMP dehydrogenase [Phycisphaerales bacterium]
METLQNRTATPGSGAVVAAPSHQPRPATPATPLASRLALEGITFDDVLLLPARSDVLPADADTSTRLTRSIRLNIPLLSAPMDTVTESSLAIALAQEGGIGIIHKNLPPDVQAREVAKVKRSANGIITDPVTLHPEDTVGTAVKLMRKFNVSGFPVTEGGTARRAATDPADPPRSGGRVIGILTRRDLKFVENDTTRVRDVMTKDGLITAPPGTTLAEAEIILNRNKVEKLLLVDAQNNLVGLITMRDIDRLSQFPRANTDDRGRLRCGAAIGVHQLDRAEALLAAEVDVIIVDTAHGHSENVLRTVRDLKARHPEAQVIAGNIATAEAARDLIDAGADAVKVGIGPGSICTTRVVTGVGVPQITAILEVCRGVAESDRPDTPVIADGGIRMSGDIAKAIAAGANCVMMGSLFAGLDESPGELVISSGRRYKTYRGMGSEGAMNAGSADRYGQAEKYDEQGKPKAKFVPEGVEGLVPYRGTLAEFTYQLVGGLRSAMGYTGCRAIDELRTRARFCKVSGATVIENHPHDIKITKESPNYMIEHLRE